MSSTTSMRTLVLEDPAPVGDSSVAERRRQSTNGQTASSKNASTMKLSINVAEDIGARLRRLAFEMRLSESSIVEVALSLLYERGDDAVIGDILRERGASLRRKKA